MGRGYHHNIILVPSVGSNISQSTMKMIHVFLSSFQGLISVMWYVGWRLFFCQHRVWWVHEISLSSWIVRLLWNALPEITSRTCQKAFPKGKIGKDCLPTIKYFRVRNVRFRKTRGLTLSILFWHPLGKDSFQESSQVTLDVYPPLN